MRKLREPSKQKSYSKMAVKIGSGERIKKLAVTRGHVAVWEKMNTQVDGDVELGRQCRLLLEHVL